jgi:hypothetical protein
MENGEAYTFKPCFFLRQEINKLCDTRPAVQYSKDLSGFENLTGLNIRLALQAALAA